MKIIDKLMRMIIDAKSQGKEIECFELSKEEMSEIVEHLKQLSPDFDDNIGFRDLSFMGTELKVKND